MYRIEWYKFWVENCTFSCTFGHVTKVLASSANQNQEQDITFYADGQNVTGACLARGFQALLRLRDRAFTCS